MNAIPNIHVCIVQPLGYVHSLGFVDQARYFRHQFRRFGASVTIAKNRLHHGAVNFILGAHLGFDASLRQRYSCVFVNLEQLGAGGAEVSAAYLELLRTSAVVDYDAANVSAYAVDALDVPLVPMLFAPYLVPGETLALEDRPIDLLFIGSMNERRRDLLDRIEQTGLQVAVFGAPLYGAERDHFILQAKAVFNAHFYPSSRFEQARVSHCLSLGTPVVSERTPSTRPHPAFEDAVFWIDGASIGDFFTSRFKTRSFYERARAGLERFRVSDPGESYAEVLAFAAGFGRAHQDRRPHEPWRPSRIHLGSGKDYKCGWLNVDILERAQPDLVIDLARSLELPLRVDTRAAGPVELSEGMADLIVANNVLEHVVDLPQLMGNCLKLLKLGGYLVIDVPYEHAPTAWQDPTHVRALNENSWIYYTDWFWYLGWFEHRFAVEQFGYLDMELRDAPRERAAFMRITLTKVATTLSERMTARTMSPQLELPDDALDSSWLVGPVEAPAASSPAFA